MRFLTDTFRQWQHWCQQWPALPYGVVFLASGLLATFLQSTPTFADPDSFYHAKMALLLRDRGIFTEFPWLQFTVLRDNFADHQFLYHILLIPFVTVLPPLIGLKLATVVFFAGGSTMWYGLLRAWQVHGAAGYTAALLVTAPFIFRMNLAKAQAAALLLLLAGLFFLQARRPVALSVVGFLYVWLYGGWPLLPVLAGLSAVCQQCFPPRLRWWERFFSGPKTSRRFPSAVTMFGAAALGVTAGVVVNPYFPHNLRLYWDQIIQIAVINYRLVIGVGGEWYPYAFTELIAGTIIVTLCVVVGLTVFALTWQRQDALALFLLLASLFFFFLTLKSRRNVEYLVPFELLFSAVAISRGMAGLPVRRFAQEFAAYVKSQKLLLVAGVIPLVLIPVLAARDVLEVRLVNAKGLPVTKFQAAARWLANNSPAGTMVFHSDWDDFPMLFYSNDWNRYVVGLDPTFMYRYDAGRYWQWERVTTGRERIRLYDIIANNFSARYVFVGADQDAMGKLVAKNPGFREVYKDNEARIFEVLPDKIPNSKHQILSLREIPRRGTNKTQ